MGAVHIPIIDEDKLDDIITALQALSAPSGTDVAISPTGMHIVTEDDVQGAISELDSAVDSVNASLTYGQSALTSIDTHSFVSTTYTNKIIKYGNLKIINLILVFNPNMTANVNTWHDVYTIPSGYESEFSDAVSEMPFIISSKSVSTMGIVQARVYNKNTVQFVMREKPTASLTYYIQLVYV